MGTLNPFSIGISMAAAFKLIGAALADEVAPLRWEAAPRADVLGTT